MYAKLVELATKYDMTVSRVTRMIIEAQLDEREFDTEQSDPDPGLS
jgi:hypothetical protein